MGTAAIGHDARDWQDSMPQPAQSAFSEEANDDPLSAASALRGFRGAFSAIALEAVTAVAFYGVWRLWHIQR